MLAMTGHYPLLLPVSAWAKDKLDQAGILFFHVTSVWRPLINQYQAGTAQRGAAKHRFGTDI